MHVVLLETLSRSKMEITRNLRNTHFENEDSAWQHN